METFGDWNDRSSILQAAKQAEDLRYTALSNQQSLVFETVFSSPEKIVFLRKAKQAGYFIRVIFVCTESPTINAARVAQRVMEGGHDVPIPKIISRYGKSIQNARHSFAIADQVYLYDNSRDGEKPRLIARISEGVKLNIIDESIPSWCAAFIDT